MTSEITYHKFDFAEAMRRLDEKKCVMRISWSQHVPLMFLILVPEKEITQKGILCESYIGAVEVKGNNNIRIKHYSPLQEDLFADDWIEYKFYIMNGSNNILFSLEE
jgi:hypothetical protein